MTDIAELNALRARIDQLEAEALRDREELEERRTSRRNMLRLAGAAAVGGLAAAVNAEPAAAADPNDVVLNLSTNAGTAPTGISMSAGSKVYGLGCYESGLGALPTSVGRPAVFGHATGSAFTMGVVGHSTGSGGGNVGVLGIDGNSAAGGSTGYGVSGHSESGAAVAAFGKDNSVGVQAHGARGALVLGSAAGATGLGGSPLEPPNRATFFYAGTLDPDIDNNLWHCYEAGTPGKWHKLSGSGTAGAFHAITPTRVYDSRAAAPIPGLLNGGNNRTVSVADGRDGNGTVNAPNLVPAGATAVAANITITGTTGAGGYLAVNPGGNTTVNASTINWFGAGQNIANGVTLTLNASRELTVICGAGGGSTHFIVDIAGYYL